MPQGQVQRFAFNGLQFAARAADTVVVWGMPRFFAAGIQHDVDTMCMTRLGTELNTHLAQLSQSGDLPRNAMGWRLPGPKFALCYSRHERHEVMHGVVREYVRRMREGFRGRHSEMDVQPIQEQNP